MGSLERLTGIRLCMLATLIGICCAANCVIYSRSDADYTHSCGQMYHLGCLREWQETSNDNSGGWATAQAGKTHPRTKCCPTCGKIISLINRRHSRMTNGFLVLTGGS